MSEETPLHSLLDERLLRVDLTNLESASYHAHQISYIVDYVKTHFACPPKSTTEDDTMSPETSILRAKLKQLLDELFLCAVALPDTTDEEIFATISSTIDTYKSSRVASFHTVCRQFYFDEEDKAAHILESYEKSKMNKGKLFGDFGDTVGQALIEMGFFRAHLFNLTSFKSSVEWQLATGHVLLKELEECKTQIRREKHTIMARQQNEHLVECVKHILPKPTSSVPTEFAVVVDPVSDGGETSSPCISSSAGSPSRPAEVVVPLSIEQRKEALKLFFMTHKSSVSVHPFIKGLKHTLLRQLEDFYQHPNQEGYVCMIWNVDSAVFTQCGDKETFMYDAVNLLANVLDCSLEVVYDEPSSEDQTKRINRMKWTLSSFMSNADIMALTKVFPKSRTLSGRPTGKVEKSQTLRQVTGPCPSTSMMNWFMYVIQRLIFKLFHNIRS